MTSLITNRRENQNSKNNLNEENTSDDSLLLMVDATEEHAPLLNIIDDDLETDDLPSSHNIPLRSRSSTSHCHVPDDKFDYGARNRLVAVLFVCIIFMVIEIIGGVLSKSTAVATDAAHMCVDVTSFVISLASLYLATQRPTKKLSFGYIRAEVLGALVSVLLIWVVTGILVYMAIQRCIDQTFEVKPNEMIIVAACGVVFNIVMFFVLHANVCGQSLPHHGHSHGGNHGHSHGGNHNHSHADNHGHLHDDHHGHSHDDHHGHSHLASHEHSHDNELLSVEITSRDNQQTVPKQSKSSNNINVRAAIIHVIGDFVQSVGVLCAAILIKIKPEYKLADPICTFAFSVLVLITTITIMRDIVLVLMEGVPSNVDYTQVVEDLMHVFGVRNAHSLHIWSLSTQKIALSVHIAIDNDQDSLRILNEVQEMLRNNHSINRSTIQIEIYDEQIMNSCENCRQPIT
ncbi:unnamed protein product [Adineta steineri]|uniref:Zinc transporter 2-like n=1 Tax=Adineta steineri TaxID=433720 RepID=A0A814UCX0_9BILA|nr:unnamed protein product [Adineta steineri]CAF3656455.1 unnamed protein product [Adineta steineri]